MSQLLNNTRRVNFWMPLTLLVFILALSVTSAFAVVTGNISGTARDPEGAVVPGVTVQVRDVQTGVVETVQTDSAGFYRFPALPVGHYDITFKKSGFANYVQTNIVIDVDTAAQVDAPMKVGTAQEQVTVTTSQAQVNTETAQMGEVIGSKEMENLPLNGRAYTDLLALQPGVVPISVQMYGAEEADNSLNNGLLSMSGGQDMHAGFMVNGANTVEGFGGGTFLVPNLDSIAEFRIITNNGEAEYGNYATGLVNVVTKSGTNQFHGDAFEFFRNTALDARNYFSPTRGIFQQNQFGGTLGGPILRNKMFFFGDYQGTRQNIGQSTGLILVPSVADKTGNLADNATQLTGSVGGPYFASVLSSRLGYTVTNGERYYTPGCTSATCVFPGAVIPQSAWDPVAAHAVALIPDPNQGSYFTTSANPETLTDNKGGARGDINTRLGAISVYYHFDPWSNTLPYNPNYAGSTVPGFPNQSVGFAQLAVASLTSRFGNSAVNVLTASYTRNRNVSGLNLTSGTTLSSLGFAPPAAGGLYQEGGSQYSVWPSLQLNNYSLGANNTVFGQYNNTYQGQDDFTKVIRTHSLKFGADYHWDQIYFKEPFEAGNGGYQFFGSETGYDFADLLVGAPNTFEQGTPADLPLRNFYVGIYGEDSWRVSRDLTVNYGVRWEVLPMFSSQHNLLPVVIPGEQSKVFPTAPVGYVFPGDPGVPTHLSDIRWNDFAPRLGIAYAPDFSSGFMHTIFGDHGKSSIRAGAGQYFTNNQGTLSWDFSAAPFFLFYSSEVPPFLSQPFVVRSTGQNVGQRFPVPPVNPSTVNFAEYEPLHYVVYPELHDPSTYEEQYDLSIERELSGNTVMSVSYVGTFGHHLAMVGDQNQGNAALCLSVSQPSEVMPGTGTCGPFGENGVYYPVSGGVINGTRQPLGNDWAGVGVSFNGGNSAYNALEATLRHTSGRLSLLLSYTFSKAIDNGSGMGAQVIVGRSSNFFRGISDYDMPQNFAASYTYELPFDHLLGKDNQYTRGWKISGISQFTTGVTVLISEPDDQSLLGNYENSDWAGTTDEPVLAPGNINGDHNPRDRKPYFNTSLFSQEPLGGEGNSPERFFHGPGLDNWNLALLKDVQLREAMSLELRAEFFNTFNHAQFYGNQSVNGDFDSGRGSFGIVTSAANPRIGQLAVKYYF